MTTKTEEQLVQALRFISSNLRPGLSDGSMEGLRRYAERKLAAHEAAKSECVSDAAVEAVAQQISEYADIPWDTVLPHQKIEALECARLALEAAAPHMQQTEAQARDAARWRAVRAPVDAIEGDPYVVQVGRFNIAEPVLLTEADRVADAAIAKQKGESE